MNDREHGTDRGVLAAVGLGLARRRLELDRTQTQLAREAGISRRTLSRLEGGESTQLTNLVRVLRALGWLDKLTALSPPPNVSPLEQLRDQGKQRKRASGSGAAHEASEDWTWDDPNGSAQDA